MRQYIVVKAEKAKGLIDAYREFDPLSNFDPLTDWVFRILSTIKASDEFEEKLRAAVLALRDSVQVVSAPSEIPDDSDHETSDELVISLNLPGSESIAQLRELVIPHLGEFNQNTAIKNIGADPPGYFCTLCPAAPARPFGNRSRVRKMMGLDALHDLDGYGVNVVIFDQGLNKDAIPAASWGGGLGQQPPGKSGTTARGSRGGSTPIEPGTAPRGSHGTMMARNILAIAPKAKLFDVPLIPERISRPAIFASAANAKYRAVFNDIVKRRKAGEAWVLVNAWGIFDRTLEVPPGDYTLNKHKEIPRGGTTRVEMPHPLNDFMDTAVNAGIDVVFAAGNCGQFTTSGRCGRHDRGEGRSIWGANAHPAVLTVGAVSANAEWLGYSSQGPAPWGGAEKPDVCAPSHFSEDNDPRVLNTGTSAASALAAGVIAAIRGKPKWRPNKLSPAALKDKINAAARGPNGTWNSRMGNGILNARALLSALGQKASARSEPKKVSPRRSPSRRK
jgi:hypothetical protein